jgi:hypothetical protein
MIQTILLVEWILLLVIISKKHFLNNKNFIGQNQLLKLRRGFLDDKKCLTNQPFEF